MMMILLILKNLNFIKNAHISVHHIDEVSEHFYEAIKYFLEY